MTDTAPEPTLIAQLTQTAPAHDWVALRVGPASCDIWRWQPGPQPPSHHQLGLGSMLLAQKCLRHEPPTDADVELAIMVVEDAIMPLARHWSAPGHNAGLACMGTELAWLANLLQAMQPCVTHATPALRLYSTASLEDLFNRFADVAMGCPARGLHLNKEQAATLILLRECMHHWGLQTLALMLPDDRAAAA